LAFTFHPFAGVNFHNFWLVVLYRRCNHPCEILSRWSRGYSCQINAWT